MGVHTAMKYAGFNTSDRGDEAYKKQVYRKRDQFLCNDPDAVKNDLFSARTAITDEVAAVAAPDVKPAKIATTDMRMTSKQAMGKRKYNAQVKKLRGTLFNLACQNWKHELQEYARQDALDFKYKKKSTESICAEINELIRVKLVQVLQASIKLVVRRARKQIFEVVLDNGGLARNRPQWGGLEWIGC